MEPIAATAALRHAMPLAATLEIEVTRADTEGVTAAAPWRPDFTTGGGVMHGGHLMAIADSIGAFCAFINMPTDTTTATIESKTNFIRPVMSGVVEVTATAIHVGRSTIVVQTDILDDAGKLVSRTTQTQAIIPADTTADR